MKIEKADIPLIFLAQPPLKYETRDYPTQVAFALRIKYHTDIINLSDCMLLLKKMCLEQFTNEELLEHLI